MTIAQTTAPVREPVAGLGPAKPQMMAQASAAGTNAGTAAGVAGMTSDPKPAEPQPTAAGTTASLDVGNPPATNDPCSLNGRWLSTVHYVTDALGQKQYCHSYIYYEIAQTAGAFTIEKGLHCGDDAVADGDFAASVDFSATWGAAAGHVQYAGRAGTSAAASGGCEVDLQKWYTVRGATLPYYLDPANLLPAAEQPAMGSTPGWEDWDMDGHPGLTGVISGVVTGKIFVAPRQWTSMHGSVPDLATTFQLPLLWDQEANVMAYDGSPLLSSSAARAAEAGLHFVQFARLSADQTLGDDTAICASVVKLAKTLTPEAAGM